MSFPNPVFNLRGAVWATPNLPSGGPATFTGFFCALYTDPHAPFQFVNVAPYNATLLLTHILKLPIGVRTWHRGDIVAPDFTTALYYKVEYKEFFYLGFPQQFEGLLITQCNANGTIPRTY